MNILLDRNLQSDLMRCQVIFGMVFAEAWHFQMLHFFETYVPEILNASHLLISGREEENQINNHPEFEMSRRKELLSVMAGYEDAWGCGRQAQDSEEKSTKRKKGFLRVF